MVTVSAKLRGSTTFWANCLDAIIGKGDRHRLSQGERAIHSAGHGKTIGELIRMPSNQFFFLGCLKTGLTT